MTDIDLLQDAIDLGIISMGNITERVMMKKRENILENHPYPIWQGKNGYWYTKYIDRDGKVKLKKLRDRDDIEEFIISLPMTRTPVKGSATIGEVYRLWISEKVNNEEIAPNTAERYEDDFNRYFTDIRNRQISDIEEEDIQDFVLEQIHKYRLSNKAFSNLRIVCFGIFRYARRKKLTRIDIRSVFSDLDISKKSFRQVTKTPQEEVFDQDDSQRIMEYLIQKDSPIELGLLFMFSTGLRVGELAALKWSEVGENCIYICRTEIRIPKESGNGYDYVVRDSPKTLAGIRKVPIPSKYEWILHRMRELNPDGEYVFENKKGRIKTFMFRKHLVTACDKAGIQRRSPHKIRKTYASILLDNGVSEKIVTELMGHTSINVTNVHYARQRKSADEERRILDMINEL